jgi:two-component system chemotaxis response regulator CheY
MRILIAEDDPASKLLVLKSAEKLGHDCVQTENGAQAIELLQETRPDVMIGEWSMQGLDGAELCRKVRALSPEKYTYLIVLIDPAQRLGALESGADDYLLKPLDRAELEARLAIAGRVSALFRKQHEQNVLLERVNKEMYEDGRRDALTRVGNRLRMFEDLETLAGRAERYGHGFSVALFDIDDFKKYNDTCGHAAGDDTLRSVARTLANHSRSGDMTYRFGGEEFLVVLPEQALEGAVIAVERRRRAVEVLAIPHPARGADGIVSVSAGVAALEAGDRAIDGLLQRVEEALAFAKHAGKNRHATDQEARRSKVGT